MDSLDGRRSGHSKKPSNFYVDTRVDRVLRAFPSGDENTRAGARPQAIPLYGSRPGKDNSDWFHL
ncbi:hypothetical protein [Actinomadura parmotrematis]|uniref:Uncharacterized protein n=1 Tax=Actinomadura parmotrematis TaxID=2864039 RepID=A0ABS7FXV3_9ACTN|nr:hypothetical protein [Actinomadura parmotrematis]MBW8485264.1 hypothetical protein [Actinomadura parmotrematis]